MEKKEKEFKIDFDYPLPANDEINQGDIEYEKILEKEIESNCTFNKYVDKLQLRNDFTDEELLTKAGEAKNATELANLEEEVQLALVESQADKQLSADPVMEDKLKAIFEKTDFSKAESQLKIMRAFADASNLEEILLYEQDTPETLKDYEYIEPFVSEQEWQQIILSETNTAAWSLIIENLIQNALDCKKATDNSTAYLRYLCCLPEQELEFYATSVTSNGEISGILKTKTGNLNLVLSPESLHNTFTLEITHKPVPVPVV